MADRLVQWLNKRGYQPVYLPTTGLHPPELYTFGRRRLIRLGSLASYLRKGAPQPKNESHQLPDIQLVQTTEKSLTGAIRFLGNAFGIRGAPSLDFVSTGDKEFLFNLSDVTSEETDLVSLKRMVECLDHNLLSRNDIQMGNLHIAYIYAYAASLEMSNKQRSEIEASLTGSEIHNLVEVGAKANMKVRRGDQLVFKPKKTTRVAFAYKCARLIRVGEGFMLHAEDVKHFAGALPGSYVPCPGVPVLVELGEAPRVGS